MIVGAAPSIFVMLVIVSVKLIQTERIEGQNALRGCARASHVIAFTIAMRPNKHEFPDPAAPCCK